MNFPLYTGQVENLPGILTDTMIRELCEPPKNILHFKGNDYPNLTSVIEKLDGSIAALDVGWTEGGIHSFPVSWSEDEIVKKFRTGEMHLAGVFVGNSPATEADLENFRPMISPFIGEQVRKDEQGRRIMSYGLSSMGYDVRLEPKFKIFTNMYNAVIDPLNMSDKNYVDIEATTDETGTYVILPPNSYLLGVTQETFDMPEDVIAMCLGKSTGARAGMLVNVTPIEPGFKGQVVIEIANVTTSPMKIYANMGVAQFEFFRAAARCSVSYADRGGKYMNQTGVQTAIV